MHKRLLSFLCCPACGRELQVESLDRASARTDGDGADAELTQGLLRCEHEHWFPVVQGIPRMLPDAVEEHWGAIDARLDQLQLDELRARVEKSRDRPGSSSTYDRRTRENFSLEWEHHSVGDKTWGMDLDDRVRWFFVEPMHIPVEELAGKVMLDAGCGNGSQSVAYSELGLEVIAMDLSSGLERGHAFRHVRPKARPDRVHFVQGDLQSPPLAPASVDIIHSAGVLHHSPDTEVTFRRLCEVLKPGGTFYVWLYKYEPVVTPVVNGVRTMTTRIPPRVFAGVSRAAARPFQLFCRALDSLGIRHYPVLDRREAALALMDIFGAPHAHYHTYEEVAGWYRSEGFKSIWGCNDGRRGFGVCGVFAGVSQAMPDAAADGDSYLSR